MKLNLNDLPQWSPRPARLLNMSPWKIPSRTSEKVGSEYDLDKYARCLRYCNSIGASASPEAVKLSEEISEYLCVSYGNELRLVSRKMAQLRYHRLLLEAMQGEVEQSTTVVELGCGYGYNLWRLSHPLPGQSFLGGEYSKNAILLADLLYREDSLISVSLFNFYDPNYKILEVAQPPVVIFTSHAIEQLPKSECFFQGLSRYKSKIRAVFHFEPVYELHDTTLLGLMRRRYAEINDYNRDLLSQLQQAEDLHIVRTEADVWGLNPLNPTSIIHWEYT